MLKTSQTWTEESLTKELDDSINNLDNQNSNVRPASNPKQIKSHSYEYENENPVIEQESTNKSKSHEDSRIKFPRNSLKSRTSFAMRRKSSFINNVTIVKRERTITFEDISKIPSNQSNSKGVILTRNLSTTSFKEYELEEIDQQYWATPRRNAESCDPADTTDTMDRGFSSLSLPSGQVSFGAVLSLTSIDEYFDEKNSDNEPSNAVVSLLIEDDQDGDGKYLHRESSAVPEAPVPTVPPVTSTIPEKFTCNYSFSYNLSILPELAERRNDIAFESLTNIKHLVDGSNSNICKGMCGNKPVIIKLIKEHSQHHDIAVQEFEIEHQILMRLNHPHIVGYQGRGLTIRGADRQFLVLERLNGGSLLTLLHEKAFTYRQALAIGRDFADALAYLHEEFHPEVTIIHRDLKPDNIVFDDKGKLKLIDFGLSTCVKRRLNSNDTYAMSGETGSLRYMAPEVILCQPYNEKVDIYSFALILWQTTTRLSPYTGLNRNDFTRHVVQEHRRPQLTKRGPGNIILPFELPEKLCDILVSCWASDWKERLSASEVRKRLSALLDETPEKGCCGF